MDWKSFFIGIGCFAGAFLIRKLDKWLYGKPKDDGDEILHRGKVFQGWMLTVCLIIAGIVYIILSLVA